MKIIKKYKDVALKYSEQDGCIHFGFEGTERKTKYVFEAEQIIDEPIWEECDLKGYFVDGYIDKFIGLAKAKRKNIKTGEPEWFFRGQYDLEYKKPNWNDHKKVFPKTKQNNDIYKKWQEQRDVYNEELSKLNSITGLLNRIK